MRPGPLRSYIGRTGENPVQLSARGFEGGNLPNSFRAEEGYGVS